MISTGGTTTLGLYDLKNPNAVQPINKGGTGATTAAAARANIGALGVGDQGLGGNAVLYTGGGSGAGFETFHKNRSGFFFGNTSGINLNGGFLPEYSSYMVSVLDDGGLFAVGSSIIGHDIFAIRGKINSEYKITKYSLLHNGMYTVDGNGFIKSASPVVNLFSDKIELNNEAKEQPITFEKLGVGDYLIKNSTGLAQEGWYVEQPKDVNGNVYHAVIYEQLENGDLSVKTYEQKLEGTRIVADLTKPVDIKENRFISIRLNELPQDDTAPLNPTIVDNEGNAAPSKYHTLENGTWVISEVDSEKLEEDKHKAYMDSLKPLTRRQFMRVLVLNGFDLDVIETHIQAIEDTQTRQLALIDWNEATEFRRNDETLLMVAGLVGLSEEHINVMWEQAMGV